MPNLYSYCIPHDDGAAPNPYGGVCTLTICKPAIRRTAKVGDWVVGTSSTKSKKGAGFLVYAMRVSKILTLKDYDAWVKINAPIKIPDIHGSFEKRVGDAIYDYGSGRPRQRPGVHRHINKPRDLRGKNALISDYFFYFGDSARRLPESLFPIARQGQGHRVHLNKNFVMPFSRWIERLDLKPNKLYGEPAAKAAVFSGCMGCTIRKMDSDIERDCRITC